MKKTYLKPSITIVPVRVERGYNGSASNMHFEEMDNQHIFQSSSTEATQYTILEEGSSNWGSFE